MYIYDANIESAVIEFRCATSEGKICCRVSIWTDFILVKNVSLNNFARQAMRKVGIFLSIAQICDTLIRLPSKRLT